MSTVGLSGLVLLTALAGCEGVAGLSDLEIVEDDGTTEPAPGAGGASSEGGGGPVGGSLPCEQGVDEECSCPEGYETSTQGDCIDVDECAQVGICDPNASCINEAGSYGCECAVGYQGDGTSCAPFESCAAIVATQPAAPTGVYLLDVDGSGPEAPFEAYCDMEVDGGGWTLVMKASSGDMTLDQSLWDKTLAYGTPHWTTPTTLNESDLAPHTSPAAGTNAKYPAFNLVNATTLRLQWLDPVVEFRDESLGGAPALARFADDVEELLVGSEAANCHPQLLVDAPNYDGMYMRHGRGRQFYGFNGTNGGLGMRWGFGSNDEDDGDWYLRNGIGTTYAGVVWKGQKDCNDCNGCYGTLYEPVMTSANLWVR